MNGDRVFIDTNVLVYAHDRGAGRKHQAAERRIAALWHEAYVPWVSVQVLQELYVTLLRKGIAHHEAMETVEDHLLWGVIENTRTLLIDGIELHQHHQLSFWDGLILAAARQAKAAELWSEDFTAGRRYEGILVVNPLAE